MKDRIIVGRFGAPFGVRGWIKVFSYTEPFHNLLKYEHWTIKEKGKFLPIDITDKKIHSNLLLAKTKTHNTPESVKCLTNKIIYIDRDQLATLPDGEYYWSDLIGLRVVTLDEVELGIVDHLFETGSNDILVVKNKTSPELLLPYTDAVVKNINLSKKIIQVDWQQET